MYSFSKSSDEKNKQCHHDLQKVLNAVIKEYDIITITGHRGKEEQEQKLLNGTSLVAFPHSKHNHFPSLAFDIAPYNKNIKGGVDWDDDREFCYMAGIVMTKAKELGINLIWGGRFKNIFDAGHFELAS